MTRAADAVDAHRERTANVMSKVAAHHDTEGDDTRRRLLDAHDEHDEPASDTRASARATTRTRTTWTRDARDTDHHSHARMTHRDASSSRHSKTWSSHADMVRESRERWADWAQSKMERRQSAPPPRSSTSPTRSTRAKNARRRRAPPSSTTSRKTERFDVHRTTPRFEPMTIRRRRAATRGRAKAFHSEFRIRRRAIKHRRRLHRSRRGRPAARVYHRPDFRPCAPSRFPPVSPSRFPPRVADGARADHPPDAFRSTFRRVARAAARAAFQRVLDGRVRHRQSNDGTRDGTDDVLVRRVPPRGVRERLRRARRDARASRFAAAGPRRTPPSPPPPMRTRPRSDRCSQARRRSATPRKWSKAFGVAPAAAPRASDGGQLVRARTGDPRRAEGTPPSPPSQRSPPRRANMSRATRPGRSRPLASERACASAASAGSAAAAVAAPASNRSEIVGRVRIGTRSGQIRRRRRRRRAERVADDIARARQRASQVRRRRRRPSRTKNRTDSSSDSRVFVSPSRRRVWRRRRSTTLWSSGATPRGRSSTPRARRASPPVPRTAPRPASAST